MQGMRHSHSTTVVVVSVSRASQRRAESRASPDNNSSSSRNPRVSSASRARRHRPSLTRRPSSRRPSLSRRAGSNEPRYSRDGPVLLTPPPENTDTAFSTAPRADLPVGGRLAAFSQAWKEIGAPRRIVRWLSHGYPLPFRKNSRGLEVTPPLHTDPLPHLVTRYSDPVKQAALESMLDELITKRALRVVDHNVPVHFSSCFLVPKKNGKQRLVINLRPLNQFLDCPTFTMDHAATIREVLAPQMWAASLDLADAYLHIPIAERYWKFLAIQVGTRRMLFTVLPFGLNAAPRVFSDVMKVLKKWCRLHGMILFQYKEGFHILNRTIY